MKIKHGVSIAGSSSEIITARKVVDILWRDHGQEAVITAGTETPEKHMENSKHADGNAEDYRIRYFNEAELIIIKGQLIMRLGYISPHYQVVLHSYHMHVEYDKKEV